MNWFVNITGLLFAIASLGSIFFAEDGREAVLLAIAGFGMLAFLIILALYESDNSKNDNHVLRHQITRMLK